MDPRIFNLIGHKSLYETKIAHEASAFEECLEELRMLFLNSSSSFYYSNSVSWYRNQIELELKGLKTTFQ